NHIPALAHLTCASSTKEKVASVIEELKANQIENILALRGDIPSNADFPLPNQYKHASELIADIKAQGDFCIGGACYPEGHPEADTIFEDLTHLKEKVDAGCEFLTTQMFFDNNILYNFMYKALKKGIDVPIVAGIMPITSKAQVKRSISLSGCMIPTRFQAIVDRFGDNPAAMKQAGIAYATDQIIDLIANGVNHVHIYTMNKPDIAGAILENLSDIYVR
ncbi:MAG: methylenetetrahydrofolate reductase, partial [Clostridiales bacterium]|nr:methylenetetrahydrofolate reductase [Clostridiales bacterium]MDY4114187.1 methylenetetrahydrofolate reductase [Roseburia sp.]